MAHTPFVRDLDFNPNRDYYLVTGGDDYRIKFWDIRRVDQPVKSVPAHSHWYHCCSGAGSLILHAGCGMQNTIPFMINCYSVQALTVLSICGTCLRYLLRLELMTAPSTP